METISFEQTLQYIVADFFDTFNLSPVSIKYSITNDMAASYKELCPLHALKEPEKIATLNRYNGTTVAPDSVDGIFSVLLNQNYILESTQQDNANWIGTIAHETTHVVDFIKYANITGATDYEDILSISKNAMFQLWTEINARSKGYYFVRKYTFENMFDEAQIPDIVNTEIPAQEKLLFQNYHSTTDGFQQAYLVSHYIGRLYALQQIFPAYFTDTQVEALIPPNPWMYEWFLFFKSHNNLEIAHPAFEDMKNILRKNFQGL